MAVSTNLVGENMEKIIFILAAGTVRTIYGHQVSADEREPQV
jgi:hypothetical protein